jgi:hypothetical protein
VVGLFRSRVALQAEILVLRHQLNVLRRKSPRRVSPIPPGGTIIKRKWLTPYDDIRQQSGDRICFFECVRALLGCGRSSRTDVYSIFIVPFLRKNWLTPRNMDESRSDKNSGNSDAERFYSRSE